MPMTRFLQKARKYEIQSYDRPKDIKLLKKTHIPFSGSLFKHPYDREKLILVADPVSSNTFYYEFKTKDIAGVEELPNQVDPEGESYNISRIWVRKGSLAVRCAPFRVEDLRVSVGGA